MTLRSSLLPAVRRFAAGIDISQREVRLVVLGQRVRAGGPVRVEFIAAAPLFAGAMAGAEIVNRSAVGSALREVFAQLPHECSAHALRCAMAMPASATLTTSAPLTQLASPRQSAMNSHALAVDRFIDEAPRHALSTCRWTIRWRNMVCRRCRVACSPACPMTPPPRAANRPATIHARTTQARTPLRGR